MQDVEIPLCTTDPIVDGVERALIAAVARKGVTLRELAEAATRAVLAPLPESPSPDALATHLRHLEDSLGARIACTQCARTPDVTFSHERACAAQTRAEQRKDPTAGPPVRVR